MYEDDPRKRLLALQQSNPSIRQQAAPKKVETQWAGEQEVKTAAPAFFRTADDSRRIDAEGPQKQKFRTFNYGPEEQKTLFGKSAAWLLPKGYETKRRVSAGNEADLTPDELLKQFDSNNEEYRRAYVADLKNRVANNQDVASARTLKLLQDSGRFKGSATDAVEGFNERAFGGLTRGVLRGADFVLPGKNTFGLEGLADAQEGQRQFTDRGRVGETAGTIAKTGVDLASLVTGAGAAEKVATKLPGVANLVSKLKDGGKFSQAALKILNTLPGSLGASGISATQTAGKGEDQNLGKDAAIGLGIDVAFGPGLNKLKEVRNLKKLASASDEASIRTLLSKSLPEAEENTLDAVAKVIAKEDDPAVIKSILDDSAQYLGKTEVAGAKVADDAARTEINTIDDLSRAAKNSFENAPEGAKPGGIERAGVEIDNASAKPIRYRRTEEGDIVIEDGRHRLEAARKAGIKDFPSEDVTAAYAKAEPVTATQKAAQAIEDVPQAAPTEAAPAASEVAEAVNKNADEAVKATPTADDIAPDADPESKAAIQSILDSLDDAKAGYDDAAKIRSKERGQRIAKGTGAYEAAGGGEAGMRAKLGSLKGQYSRSGFNAIDASPEVQNTILDTIEKSGLKDFEKLNAQNAVRKVWGVIDAKPTPADIKYIRQALGDDVADAVEEAVASSPTTWRERAAAIASTPKAAMATADLSAPLRQGAVLGSRFPKEFKNAAKEQVKFMGSQKAFDAAMDEIRSRPSYELMQKAKLSVDAADGITGTEEAFMSSLLETKIAKKAVVGKVVAASDRAYTGFLTKLRADVFDKVIKDTQAAGVELDDKALESLGKFINSASGRGNLGSLEKHAGLLSKALFSPRLWKSRLDLLNPVYYARLSGPARKLALQSSGSFALAVGTVLSVAAMAGATVELDPRSADFAKIKIGNTRYDVMGGLQQNIRLGAQLITGEKIDSATGEVATLGPDRGFGKPSRKDLLYQFFENKENPLISYGTKLLEGSDAAGNPINPATEGAKLLVPLNIQSTVETAKDVGSAGKGAAMNVPGVFGVGVQTYGNNKSKDTKNGEFVGKVTPDMVTGPDGKPILDDKGKPVKVKFPEGATELQKKALIDDKRNSALAAQYKRSLSAEDQALLNLSDEQRDQYLKEGKIDQKRYDELDAQAQIIKNVKGIKVPDGAKTDAAKGFFQVYNGLNKKDKAAYLDAPADDAAYGAAEIANKNLPKGLKKLQPTNRLAKAYAEYEEDMNSNEYNEVEKLNKTKAFYSHAYKEQAEPFVKDVYTEGGSADLKYLMSNGAISKEDLNKAIELDNELYNSGLTGSLKFSKKFRNEFGFGIPDGDGSGGSGGGSKSKEQRAQLAALMPDAPKKTTKAPEFSNRSRKIKLKVAGAPKSTGKSKKISIKL